MKLRDPRHLRTPELIIIPMIDIMFFLLVFFMLSTLYMVQLKTIPVHLPQATQAALDTQTTFALTLKEDGSLYLSDQPTDLPTLLQQAAREQQENERFSIVIRAEKNVSYEKVIHLMDELKGVGVTRFGLATEGANKP